MTAATIDVTPQFDTVDDLADVIRVDFAARGIAGAVEVGEFDPEQLRGQPRVMLSYGRGTIGEPEGHFQPGNVITVRGTTNVARPLLDVAQRYRLKIHAPAPTGLGAGPNARAARKATNELMRQTMRAIRRALAAPFRAVADLDWPTQIPDYEDFVHGSLAVVDVVIASPVLDDAKPTATATAIDVVTSYELPDGTFTPPDPVLEP